MSADFNLSVHPLLLFDHVQCVLCTLFRAAKLNGHMRISWFASLIYRLGNTSHRVRVGEEA